MKAINNVVLRILFAVILGVLLIVWPLEAINYLIMAIGILFLLPGFISIFGYLFQEERSSETLYLIESIGSVLLGLALIIVPDFFVGALMYILTALLIFAGIMQIRALFLVRKRIRTPFAFYLTPIAVLLVGGIILFNPFKVIETTFMILGIACVIYSISELINYVKFLRKAD